MKKQFAVIGMGRFGFNVAKTLAHYGADVIAIDHDEERVKKISDFVDYAVQVDAMDEKALREIGIQNIDTAIVSIGENIEANIIVVMILKEMEIRNIIAKAVTTLHGKVLEHLKVQRIIYPERDMAVRVAQSLIRTNIIDQLTLSEEYSIVEIAIPEKLIGKTLAEAQLRAQYGVNLIAIKKQIIEKGVQKEIWNVSPDPNRSMVEGDILVLIGSNENLKKLGVR